MKRFPSITQFFKKYAIWIYALYTIGNVILNFDLNEKRHCIRGDGIGYYNFLPAMYTYHDSSYGYLNDIGDKYYKGEHHTFFNKTNDSLKFNKYYSGVSFLQTPFYLAADNLSTPLGYDRDGFSFIYQALFIIGASFYFFLLLIAFHAFVNIFKTDHFVAFIVTTSFWLASNWIDYSSMDLSFTHVYNLCFACLFFNAVFKYSQTKQGFHIALAGFFFGLMVILRPINGLGALFIVPFLGFTNFIALAKFSFSKYKHLLIAALALFIPIFYQLLVYKWQCNQWYVYGYGKEYFDWEDSHFFAFLFGVERGWFILSPITLLGLVGIYYLPRKIGEKIYILGYLFVIIFILSCWWYWNYGYSYGNRALLDYMYVPAIGLQCLLVSYYKQSMRFAIVCCILVVFIYLNLIQFYQYFNEITIKENMNWTYFKRLFLRTEEAYKFKVILNTIPVNVADTSFDSCSILKYDINYRDTVTKLNEFSVAGVDIYSPSISLNYNLIKGLDSGYFYTNLDFKGSPTTTKYIFSANDSTGKSVLWKEMPLIRYENDLGNWNRAVMKIPLSLIPKCALIKTFVVTEFDRTKLKVKNFNVRVSTTK
ncbi:MAG: hypothetical protein SGJ04_02760 [Bacteroidota bacterium]|nr:hypothetical protein [Bacteroidota bacterium]